MQPIIIGIQTPQRPMAEITDDEFDRTVAVDLKGVWNCMCYEILQMLIQGQGAIVNTSSAGGVVGFPGQAAYIACKHAVLGLTKTAAIDYAGRGIRINAVCPGVIQTAMVDELIRRNPALEQQFTKDIPAGRPWQAGGNRRCRVMAVRSAGIVCERSGADCGWRHYRKIKNVELNKTDKQYGHF